MRLLLVLLGSAAKLLAVEPDLVVCGGTPGGIATAVTADSVRCTVDGVPRKNGFSGRCAQLGPVAAGVTVTLRFANPTTNVTQTVCGRAYHCTLRGNTVVRIDPPGVVCPLYDRQAMMATNAPTIPLTRFVSDETSFLDQTDLCPRRIAK
jgi:hypothetical protein